MKNGSRLQKLKPSPYTR